MGVVCLPGGQAFVHFTGLFPHQMTQKLESTDLKLRLLIFFVHLLNNPTTQELADKLYIL